MVASFSSAVTTFVGNHGIAAVFVLMAIDAVFPAASELVMVYAGAVAAGAFGTRVSLFGSHLGRGAPAYVAVALAGTIGYVVGAIVGWAIGRFGGRPLLERHGRAFHLTRDKLDRAERWFDRWDDLAVLVGRITPVVRSFISIPAGIFEMRFAPYVVLTAIGSAIWAFALAGVGWGFGTSYDRFHNAFGYVEYVVVAGVVVGAAYLIIRRRRAPTTLADRVEDPTH